MAGAFAGKVALVTGGGSGMGRAAALAFAHEGARVTVADVDAAGGEQTAQAIAAAGGEGFCAQTDVCMSTAVQALVAHTLERFGQLDCAFNNAGINEEHGPLADCPQQLWDRILAVNLTGGVPTLTHA